MRDLILTILLYLFLLAGLMELERIRTSVDFIQQALEELK